ncbi:MAG: peptidylprolyl isomerase [Candidatus Marinimicrobia bacterium]|nr:peptidylprolyl isomerase [Candidatus Neomarinimicrobiota bacterium]MCF7903920.1 peptidylprolyl isomerase [Candidatus Neomarinimicrobiota bacterium]
MNISKDKVASIDYTLTNDQGEVLDSSSGREPLAYLHGHGNLIPGLEKELDGKTTGDKLVAIVPPSEAYGVRSDELLQDFALDQFQNPAEVQVGVQFQVKYGEDVHIATVTKIENNMVSVDMNHPLADQTLHFDVEVMEVREPTTEELEHGHVHGAGGHQH